MKTIIAVVLALSFARAEAGDWTSTDSTLLGVAVSGLAADWAQTRYIATSHGYHETNRFLGSHPSVGRVNTYFAASIASTVGLALWMPKTPRFLFLGNMAALEMGLVLHNHSIGIQARF
jgi:hypothetical protein